VDVGDTLTSFEGSISSNETSLDTKQVQLTDQIDITSRDIVADNITLNPPDIGDLD
jgi:hypothetical protein